MPQLGKAATQFLLWMNNYKESHRKSGDYDDHNKALVSFLSADHGFKYVKTFDDLCQLAELLETTYEFNTKNPPCSQLDFAMAIERADPESFGDVKPTMPDVTALALAAEHFDKWMNNYKESHRKSGDYDDHNKALVSFLSADHGFKYVKTFDDLCQLAESLQAKKYDTKNPPCTRADFAKAIERADPESFGGVKPTTGENDEHHGEYKRTN